MVGSSNYLMAYDPNNGYFNQPGSNKGKSAGPGDWWTKSHALTVDQIPSHTHTYADRMVVWDAEGNHTDAQENNSWNSTLIFKNWGTTTMATGGGKGHNHFCVPPYFVVVVWQRTA